MSTIPRQHAPNETENVSVAIAALQFDMAVHNAGQPHNFFNFAVVPLILPHQQIRDFSRVVETMSHKPGRDDRHILAVEPRP